MGQPILKKSGLMTLDTEVIMTLNEKMDKGLYRKLICVEGVSKDDLVKLKKYGKMFKNGEARIHYKYSNNRKIGRVYPENYVGLQTMSRNVRNVLAKETYYDIDIKNAQPTILLNICKRLSIECKVLEEYINRREEKMLLLNENRDIAKDNVMTLFFSSNYTTDIEFFNNLHNELYNVIVQKLKEPYEEIWKYTREKDKENKDGSFLSTVLQTKENEIVMGCVRYLRQKEVQVGAIIHDGFLVEKKGVCMIDLLLQLRNYVNVEFGYTLEFVKKEMESCYEEMMSKMKIYETNELVNDDLASKAFVELCGHHLVYCNAQKELYVFDENTGLWSDDNNVLKQKIHSVKEKLVFRQYDRSGNIKVYDYSGTNRNNENMKKFITNYVRICDNFIETKIETSLGKLLFQDGIYTLKTGEFAFGFNPDIVFVDRIPRNYRDMYKINPQLVEELTKKIFFDPFKTCCQDTHNKFLKQVLAMGIGGHYNLKKFMMGIGSTNTAKGVISTALINSFGGYISTFNLNSLLIDKFSGGDEAKKFSWLFKLNNKRIVLGNEVKMDGKTKFDGNKIKNIVGGGDVIDMRLNHQDEVKKTVRAFMVMFMNDNPCFEPFDCAINDRALVMEFSRTFVDKGKVENEDECEKDMDLKSNFIRNDDYKDAFVSIILKSYKENVSRFEEGLLYYPDDMVEIKNEWFIGDNKIEKALKEHYELTGNENDYITVKEVVDTLYGEIGGMTKRKFEIELNSLIKTKLRRVEGKVLKVKSGIKLKVRQCEIEEG